MSVINKGDLVSLIADKMGSSKNDAKIALDAVIDTISEQLVQSNEISLIGFANFKVAQTAERAGRNPSTGAAMTIPAKKVVKVTIGKALKDSVNR
jgi:DNA-binding protein HU-beta